MKDDGSQLSIKMSACRWLGRRRADEVAMGDGRADSGGTIGRAHLEKEDGQRIVQFMFRLKSGPGRAKKTPAA